MKELVIDCTGNSDDSSSTNKVRSSRQQQMRDRRNSRKRLTGRSDASPAPGSVALRKGESSAAVAASNSKKRSRALERRNERRRARQRGMSPRSPDGGPRSTDPRIGKPLPELPTDDEDEQRQLKRIRNRKAMKDAMLHSTAWRYVKLDTAPRNLLPGRPDIALPFATELDCPLEEFDPDSELSSKCAISMSFGQASALSLQSATHHEVLPCCMDYCVRMSLRLTTCLC